MADRRDSKNRKLEKGEYQKQDGRYMYKYTDTKGNKRFVYSWTLTQTDRTPKGKKQGKCLRELEKEILKDLHDEIDTFNAHKQSLDDFYRDYINQRKDLKLNSFLSYEYIYKNHIHDDLGNRRIVDIKYSDIKALYTNILYEKKLKISTVKAVNKILNALFKIAIRNGCLRLNPTEGVISEFKQTELYGNQKRHPLTIQQQNAFVNFTQAHFRYKRWMPLFTFMLGTGCRVGEALGLTWDDCDFENNIISINHTLLYKPETCGTASKFHISTPKSKAGIRSIPMFADVKKAILHEYERQKQFGFCKTVINGYTGFIFLNNYNNICCPEGVDGILYKIVRFYNEEEMQCAKEENREPNLLPHISSHILRHTFCTRLCEQGVNIKVIQEIMGHSKISTTMDIYSEATLEKKIESFESLEGKIKIC